MGGGAGAGEEVEDDVVRSAGRAICKHPSNELDWLWSVEDIVVAKELAQISLRVSVCSQRRLIPRSSGTTSFLHFVEETAFIVWTVIAVLRDQHHDRLVG